MGVVPIGDGFESFKVAKPVLVLDVHLVEVDLVPDGEYEAGAVEFGVGVQVLDGPVVERGGVPWVEAVGLGERMKGARKGDDGKPVVSFAHLGAGEGGPPPGTGDGDVVHADRIGGL